MVSHGLYSTMDLVPLTRYERRTMTDTAVDPQVTDENKPAEKAVPERASLSPMAKMILDQIEGRFSRAKEIAAQQEKVGDVGKLLTEAIESSTDKKVVELRKKVEEANQFILDASKAMEKIVKPTLNVPSDEELAKQEEEYKALANEINTYGGVFHEEVKREHPELSVFDYYGQLPGKKRGAKSGQGQGTSRPRVNKIEYTEDQKGEQGWKTAEKDGKSTFSVLSQVIKSATDNAVDVSARDFHEAWTDQNGKKDWSELPDVTTFVYTATGPNDKRYSWTVRVTK